MQHGQRVYIVILATVAALLIVHGGTTGLVAGSLTAIFLCVLSSRRPEAGLLSTFPLLYVIQPAPVVIGWEESLFATVIVTTFVSSINARRSRALTLLRGDFGTFLLLSTVFIVLNFFMAIAHEAALKDWIRGVIPFLFITYLIPVCLLIEANPKLVRELVFSIACSAVLFAGHVIQVYINEQLWKPYWYVFENDRWIRIAADLASNVGHENVRHFFRRVTAILPQSTDMLLPLSVSWGVLGFVLLAKESGRVFALWTASVGIIAIVLTYTRSMLLTVLMVMAGICVLSWKKGHLSRFLLSGVLVVSLVMLTIQVFDLHDVYRNRFFQTVLSFAAITQSDFAFEDFSTEIKDENVTARLEEYKIAWRMFMESPWLGQGFGVMHPMRFSAGFGYIVEQQVAYIHNWLLYMLMVGGVAGASLYVWLLAGPALCALRTTTIPSEVCYWLLVTLASMVSYALYFAVFRLIGFNLLLAFAWGIVLGCRHSDSTA